MLQIAIIRRCLQDQRHTRTRHSQHSCPWCCEWWSSQSQPPVDKTCEQHAPNVLCQHDNLQELASHRYRSENQLARQVRHSPGQATVLAIPNGHCLVFCGCIFPFSHTCKQLANKSSAADTGTVHPKYVECLHQVFQAWVPQLRVEEGIISLFEIS